MIWIGSIFRRLGIRVGNSSGGVHQDVRNSNAVVQVAGDMNVNSSNESRNSQPKIGEAYFPELGVTLSVHDFRAGGDRLDDKYQAVLATEQIARFVVALEEKDYGAFGIKDNQGRVSMPSTVTVPEGQYDGTVTWIEMGQRESSYLRLRCWFTVP